MNAIILCGGSRKRNGQGGGMAYKEEIKDLMSELPLRFKFQTKANFSLGKETVIQRMVRLLHEQNITDITVAYTYDKPIISGVSFRRVEYRYGSLSTILQCLDLIDETMIILGDAVFSRMALEEVLRQRFDGILIALDWMTLTKPTGAKYLRGVIEYYKERIMSESLGFSQHYIHYLCLVYPMLNACLRIFVCRHFIRDCDTAEEAEKLSIIISDYLDKGEEPLELDRWQKRFTLLNLGPPYPSDRGWILEVGK